MQKESGPIGKLGLSQEIHIIGAGISGLLMAYYLKKAGYKITIFEKNSRPGGKIHTVKTSSGIAETAANAIFTNEDVMELLQELKLPYLLPAEKLKKKIWKHGKARSFPLTSKEFLRLILGLFKKLPADLDSLSVQDFFAPLLGERAAYEILSAVFGGVYASDAKTLHFKSVFKNEIRSNTYFGFIKELVKKRKEKSHKPTSISFEGGMQTFINALSDNLKENIVYDEKKKLSEDANSIICADAQEAAEMLEEKHPGIARELRKINYQSLSSTTCFFEEEPKPLKNSFGILFPPNSPFKSSGVLNNSAIFKKRTEAEELFSLTFISRDLNFEKPCALKDMSLLDPASDWQENLRANNQTSWTRGIPIYSKERHLSVKKLRSLFHGASQDLVLFGNYIDGISIREMVSMAKAFAIQNKKFP